MISLCSSQHVGKKIQILDREQIRLNNQVMFFLYKSTNTRQDIVSGNVL